MNHSNLNEISDFIKKVSEESTARSRTSTL